MMIDRSVIFTALTLFPLAALAEEPTGSIRGTIFGPEGETVPYLWIRAVDSTAEAEVRAESSESGQYEISGLAAGTYTVEINTPCCAYRNFKKEDVRIDPAQALELDIHLEEGGSFNTVGDDPGVIASFMRSEAVIPDEPPPRTADGMPDFSGMWLIGIDPFPEPVDAKEWAQELFDQRRENKAIDHPHNQCLPGNPPIPGGAAPFMAKFVQTDDLIVILFEDYPGFRQVFLDGREHPEYPNPSWMGHSVGRWEGDTLVIDTVGFNDRGWMSMYPRSEELHIVERYSRPEYGRIDLEMTVTDPSVYNKPWTRRASYHLVPQAELIEFVCENNKWAGATAN